MPSSRAFYFAVGYSRTPGLSSGQFQSSVAACGAGGVARRWKGHASLPARFASVRITTGEHAAEAILWPAMAKLLPRYPDIKVELIIDYGLTDIVAERYDAGVRLGEQVAKDMIAARIGPDFRVAVVGPPSYFAKRPKPKHPQDLTAHDCINIRLPTYGGIYAWEFEKRGRALKVRVEGQLVFNNMALRMNAALAGLGLAYVPEDQVQQHVAKGSLVRVLGDWCAPFSGYHLYYPSRRQAAPAFAVLVEALRYRGSSR
jgi:DNA-binding transcriptional LysR family regulator